MTEMNTMNQPLFKGKIATGVAFIAIVIALLALGLAIWEGHRVMQIKHQLDDANRQLQMRPKNFSVPDQAAPGGSVGPNVETMPPAPNSQPNGAGQ